MPSENLLPLIRALECELHEPNVRHDPHRLNELLHPEFREFGRSGRSYTKAEILEYLAQEKQPAKVQSQDFFVQSLAPDVLLLTYKSAHIGAGGILERHTLRASVWKLEPSGWQVLFHQGTPTDGAPESI